MNGPLTIDPSKLAQAKRDHAAALSHNRPELVDGEGNSHAANPFDTAPDGTVSFNRWTDGSNNRSAQDTFFNDTEKQTDGTTKTIRRAAWQMVPEYYNDEGGRQFDYITQSLKDLQTTGFNKMDALYKKALKDIG